MPSKPTILCGRCTSVAEVHEGRSEPIAMCSSGHVTPWSEVRELAPCIGCGRAFAVPLGTIWFPCSECVEAKRFGANETDALAKLDQLAMQYPDETIARQVRDGVAAKANERWRKEDDDRRTTEEDLRRAGLQRQIEATHQAAIHRIEADLAGTPDVVVPVAPEPEDTELEARRTRMRETHAKRVQLSNLEADAIREGRTLLLAELPDELRDMAKTLGMAK